MHTQYKNEDWTQRKKFWFVPLAHTMSIDTITKAGSYKYYQNKCHYHEKEGEYNNNMLIHSK